MPRPIKPPRLVLKRYKDRPACWVIRDGQKTRGTGCSESQLPEAEGQLGEYLAQKYKAPGQSAAREILIAEILATYTREHAPTVAQPENIAIGVINLMTFWGDMNLAQVRASSCREYTIWRVALGVSDQTARHDLETLRAAINYYHREYTLDSVPVVTLPQKSAPRSRWLTRDEIASLLWACYQNAHYQHVARYILLGVYTGTRSKAMFNLTWMPQTNGGWIDLEHGVMHRAGAGQRRTNKRQPPVRLAARLIPHLQRWRAVDMQLGQPSVLHYRGKPITKLRRSWKSVRGIAGLGPDVVGHTLRHTRATWLMQAGVDLYEAAGYLGMSVQTLENVYGHHHPNFQQTAADSFSKRGVSGT